MCAEEEEKRCVHSSVLIPVFLLPTGLAPYTFVGCQAGTILEDLKSTCVAWLTRLQFYVSQLSLALTSRHDIMEPRVVWGLVLLAAAGFALPFVLKSSAISAPPTRPKKE